MERSADPEATCRGGQGPPRPRSPDSQGRILPDFLWLPSPLLAIWYSGTSPRGCACTLNPIEKPRLSLTPTLSHVTLSQSVIVSFLVVHYLSSPSEWTLCKSRNFSIWFHKGNSQQWLAQRRHSISHFLNEWTNEWTFFSRRLENVASALTLKHSHVVNGWLALECIGLQMFNYQLTYLPTLKMWF